MNFTSMLRIAAVGAILAVSSGAADASAQGTPQTHHCKTQDGSMDTTKTKKQCLAAKGTWAKDATTPAAATTATPAAAPAASAPAPKN